MWSCESFKCATQGLMMLRKLVKSHQGQGGCCDSFAALAAEWCFLYCRATRCSRLNLCLASAEIFASIDARVWYRNPFPFPRADFELKHSSLRKLESRFGASAESRSKHLLERQRHSWYITKTSMESTRFELLLTKEGEEGSNQGPVGV